MVFNELVFLLFFPLVVGLYFISSRRGKIWILFFSSYIFYSAWNYRYLVLIFISTLLDFWIGKSIYSSNNSSKKKGLLLFSIFVNLGILFYFKYFNFVINVLNDSGAVYLNHIDVLLPVGISFFTFQSMSYTIDIYRGILRPEKSFICFATYISFFPQLVAGPIVRARDFIPQLQNLSGRFDWGRVGEGISLFIFGLLKKKLADHLAFVLIDPVFSNIEGYQFSSILVATFGFLVQIFFDFSGYTDMAIGCAKIMNFHLPPNFNFPYLSVSFSEFWKRWHISLSSWLRDYLYIALGGNRRKVYRNLFITMVLGGIWHGANYTFIIWGALHGILLVIERYLKFPDSLNIWGRILYYFYVQLLILFSWFIFRVDSLASIEVLFSKTFIKNSGIGLSDISLDPVAKFGLLLLFLIHIYGYLKEKQHELLDKLIELTWRNSLLLRSLTYAVICLFAVVYSESEINPFIYFQF